MTFSIVIDDLRLGDGKTIEGLLGGGGPQAAFGMCIWGGVVGLVANVGQDLPQAAWRWLRRMGIDVTGIGTSAHPTLRAWQLLDDEGERRQAWQVPVEAVRTQTRREVSMVPQPYWQARGAHLPVHPEAPDVALAQRFRSAGATVCLELFRPALRAMRAAEVSRLVQCGDLLSLNMQEAVSLVGAGDAHELLDRLLEAGAGVIALRMGSEGSLVVNPGSGGRHFIAAPAVAVANPLGAGNAYSGGFLAGWVQTGDVVTAGRFGTVSASFVLEQPGVPDANRPWSTLAASRLKRMFG